MSKTPKSPKTYCVETRLDVRHIASLAQHYRSKGIDITNKSQLLSTIVADLYTILLNNDMLQPFLETEKALEFLELAGLASRKKVARGLLLQIQREAVQVPEERQQSNTIEARAAQVRQALLDKLGIQEKG